jgi:DNA-binding NarL/FixJ family response regulator
VQVGNSETVHLRCLIVDDSEEFLASARRLLDSQGLDVVASATTGAEALRLAGELTPDVALVDVELGPEDGIELARELQQRVPTLRAILISAHTVDDLEELLADDPGIPYVPKSSLGVAAIEAVVANGRRER